MESATSLCSTHNHPLQTICLTCGQLLCFKCLTPHSKKGCKGAVYDLPAYATESLLPKLEAILSDLDQRRHSLDSSAKEFVTSLPVVLKSLILLRGKLQQSLSQLSKAISVLEGYSSEGVTVSSTYLAIKAGIERQLAELRQAIQTDNMGSIIRAISLSSQAQQAAPAGIGDGERKLVEATSAAVTRMIESKELDGIGDCLQSLVATCQRELRTEQPAVDVRSQFVYGVNYPMSDYRKLCRYDITAKKLTPCATVMRQCSVLQTGKRVFLAGGFTSQPVNGLWEFLEESQTLAVRAPMNYARYAHAMLATSATEFLSLAGFDGTSHLPYCEVYSLNENRWSLLPSLSQPRSFSAAVLMGDAEVYVIGGLNSRDTIERLDLREKHAWTTLTLSAKSEVTLSGYPVAFPVAGDEVLIMAGNNTAETAVLNTKESTVKKRANVGRADKFLFNGVCIIGGDAYVMGTNSGYVHIYRAMERKFVEELPTAEAVVKS